jgi:dTDP-4-amino-4,6-dideoxygalactose transaminase
MIKFIDLNAQYLEIKDEIDSALRSCISESSFIKGRTVTEFEDDFASYLGTGNCIGCGNGTDALEMIIAALGIRQGDEVIVPALSWIATAEAVNNAGAEPVFVDVDPVTYTIDVSKIEEKINSRTKAIIPVHLYGCPCEMDTIDEIAKKYNIHIIEDCAQAHGAEYRGRKAGTFGIASAFSFFPSKNLGAFGDAGAVVTGNPEIAEKIRRISNHGQLDIKHSHAVIGRNSRLDTLHAAVLKVKLKYLDAWNEKRIEIAHYYKDLLGKHTDIILPEYGSHLKHVFHLFVIRTVRRKEITDILNDNGISWGIHYPNSIPFLDAYNYKNHVPSDFPVSYSITKEILSLLIHPHLDKTTAEYICSKILA